MYIISRSKNITIISWDTVFNVLSLKMFIIQNAGVRKVHSQFLIFNIKMPCIVITCTVIKTLTRSLLYNIGLYS